MQFILSIELFHSEENVAVFRIVEFTMSLNLNRAYAQNRADSGIRRWEK